MANLAINTALPHVRRREGPLSFLSYRQLSLVDFSDFDDFSALGGFASSMPSKCVKMLAETVNRPASSR
jgi:hypothetical protein